MTTSHREAAPRPYSRRNATPDEGSTYELRGAILNAMSVLLSQRQFSDIAVSDILAAADVARGTFYFYFASKYDVLAELVRQAVAQGYEPHAHVDSDEFDLRAGLMAGARLWRDNGVILRAIAENWHSDPQLKVLWQQIIDGFTQTTVDRIAACPNALQRLQGVDVRALASALSWLVERIFYLSSTGTAPFDDEEVLIDTLTHIWTATLDATAVRPAV